MLILAFETSAKAASTALLEDEKLLGESWFGITGLYMKEQRNFLHMKHGEQPQFME